MSVKYYAQLIHLRQVLYILFLAWLLVLPTALFAQAPDNGAIEQQSTEQQSTEQQPTEQQLIERRALRNGFANLTLGASLSQITDRLRNSDYFTFNEAVDVSIVPISQNALISVSGDGYIDQGFLQFDDDVLISIQLILNSRQIDHFSLYTALSEKYGEPNSLNPQVILWESDQVLLSMERPLILKYIDRRYFDLKQNRTVEEQQQRETELDLFLQQL